MAFLDSIRVLLLSLIMSNALRFDVTPQEVTKIFEENCKKLAVEPYFDPEMVTGKPWRIYYTWNMDLKEKCLDMTFQNVTQAIVSRVYNDMVDYLEVQPFWDAASLLVTMGHAHHEMLLFADQGPAGRFNGVPNVVRDGNISPSKNTVPLIKIYIKLLHDGKYLIMSDCNIGVSTLSARKDSEIYRAEVQGVADLLNLGPGAPACINEFNSNEKMGMSRTNN